MRMTTILTSVALTSALALLSACTTEVPPVVIETPSPTPTLSIEPSPSSTPSPSPTRDGLSTEELLEILPEHADIPDIRGAMVVARYVLELRQEVYSGSAQALEIWRSLSTENCMFCASVVERSQDLVSSGLMMTGGDIEFSPRPVDARLEYGSLEVAYVVERFMSSAWQHVDTEGKVVAEGEGATVEVYMRLKLVDGIWMVDGVDVETS